MQSAGWYVSPYHGNGALMLPILASWLLIRNGWVSLHGPRRAPPDVAAEEVARTTTRVSEQSAHFFFVVFIFDLLSLQKAPQLSLAPRTECREEQGKYQPAL